MLGERLEKLIKTLGIKKGDFAERLNFSQAYISMIISGNQKLPSDRFFDSVKREFNVNIDWLKNGDGEMFNIEDKNISPAEKTLITKYNQLPLSERKVIDEILDAMVIKSQINKNELS